MKSATAWWLILLSMSMLVAMPVAAAQTAEPDATAAEVRLLRITNERLLRENEALREEVAALKKKRADGEAATKPIALSAAGAAAVPKRYVFIMDGSGSMLNEFDKERNDVRRWIEDLKADQWFGVVFDQAGGNNPFPKTLLPATEENKARVLALFSKLFVRGQDDFSASLKTAFSMNPDVIWWTGDVPQNTPSDLSDIKKWNTRKARINTSPRYLADDKEGRTLWFAWKLASDSGGTCFDESGQPLTTAPPEPPQLPAPSQPNGQLKVDVNRR
jgi:hypothetical protein